MSSARCGTSATSSKQGDDIYHQISNALTQTFMTLLDRDDIVLFAAEMAAGTIIETASRLGIPVSTTHVISS
jgi:phosphate/sulfate permease